MKRADDIDRAIATFLDFCEGAVTPSGEKFKLLRIRGNKAEGVTGPERNELIQAFVARYVKDVPE